MSGERILVVEDNPKNLKLARVLLTGEGYQVRTASDAEEAIDILASFEPRLILMDLQLPGIDGTEALRQIRESDAGGAVPVVAVTAFAMNEDRDRAYAAGFDGYVQKPISVRGLQQQVHDFLTTRGSAT